MSAGWRNAIEQEWTRRRQKAEPAFLFPLIAQSFDEREIVAATETLLTGQLTMGDRVREYEQRFAEFVGAKFAVMVNSGSSANLLSLAVAANPSRARRLCPGDEVLIPSVCWSTSVWPVIQMGLVPVFVDVRTETLNADPDAIRANITPRTRGIVAVHVLGNSTPMRALLDVVAERDLILIEDTCESLGSRWNGQYLGTLGELGTYSFYYSHHITTGEGGMVVCNDAADHDLLVCLRAHGWSRPLSNREQVERENPSIDPRFLFVNVGYNFRPLEIQAAFGLCQLERLTSMNRMRGENRSRLTKALTGHPRWRKQLDFPVPAEGTEPAWFGFPCLLDAQLRHHHRSYLDYLTREGVENRPIVSGNFVRQPALKLHGIACDPLAFPNAEAIAHRGFFIGIHTEHIEDAMLGRLADILLGYDFA